MTADGSGASSTGPRDPVAPGGVDPPAGSPGTGDAADSWVAVAAAGAVAPGEVVEATLEGADLVVWRTESGIPCVMEARCPHQWSHLGGSGAVAGEELVCLTHFWTFATDGSGWKENLDGRRDRKGDIDVYPCREDAEEIRVRRPSRRDP
ncbi:MAG: Rieske 2Fe-2S domain-containing protein [Acidimicrobiia bacterium]|nr:Rieske 2Fe-2S domain-containing protein [Acidimicrobiia bacterium]